MSGEGGGEGGPPGGGRLPDETTVAEVALTVKDLARASAFYREVLGLTPADASDGEARLGSAETPFLRLVEDGDAPSSAGRTRLYHLAILFPDRAALATALRRLLELGWSLQGAADHLVSEALYLSDPEGNGIELYRDRPPEAWERSGDGIRMETLPLDVEALLREAEPSARGRGVPAATRLGHVHLQVSDLARAERFYREVVGLALTARYGRAASFLAAGGYHHHLGINTWGTAGAPAAPEGAQGLRWYRLRLPPGSGLTELVARLDGSGAEIALREGEVRFRDPSGHGIVVDAAE